MGIFHSLTRVRKQVIALNARQKRIGVFMGAIILAGCTSVGLPKVGTNEAEKPSAPLSESAERIKSYITFLADDALEGREAGTEGYQKASQYVADEMAKIGVAPAGDVGSYFQAVPLLSVARDQEQAGFEIIRKGGIKALENGEDFLIGMSTAHAEADITADAVFVGYGIDAPQFGINDFDGLDVRGKIAVILSGSPDSLPSAERAHFGRGKIATLSEKGAIGYVTVQTTQGQKRTPWKRMKTFANSKGVNWMNENGNASSSSPGIMASATLSPDMSASIFEGAAQSYAEVLQEADTEGGIPKGFDLPVQIRMTAANAYEKFSSRNVVGLIEGSDPVLKNEYVVLSAHLDHVGVSYHDHDGKADAKKDVINNGALDNASGIATTLEAARKFMADKKAGKGPRRSILIVAVTAEEKGLVGSDYFAQNPTVEKSAMVANVNLDMPLIMHDFVDVIAFGADRSSLGKTVRDAAAPLGVSLIKDPVPEMAIFVRSDHYRFVQQGVPSVFLFLGFGNGGEEKFRNFMANHYHSVSDDLNLPLDFEQGARFATLNYEVAKSIANDNARPTWNEGDFFGTLYSK